MFNDFLCSLELLTIFCIPPAVLGFFGSSIIGYLRTSAINHQKPNKYNQHIIHKKILLLVISSLLTVLTTVTFIFLFKKLPELIINL